MKRRNILLCQLGIVAAEPNRDGITVVICHLNGSALRDVQLL